MRILERYINNSIIKIFASTVLIFSFMYILIDVTSSLDEIIDRKIPMDILIQYYVSSFPITFVQISSIACLISVLFTFSALNNSNEIVAMRASGLNFWQITKPALIFGLLISILIFWINEDFVPKATATTKRIRNEHMILKADRLRKKRDQIRNLTFYGLNNRLYFIDKYNPETYELEGITIIEHDNNTNIKQKIVAYQGNWTKIAWKFTRTQVTVYDHGDFNSPSKVKVYNEKLMDIKETPEDFLKQRLNVSSMNIRQLRDYISRFENSGATKALNNLRVDLHQKIAFPFGNFVIVLVGLPFALMVRNRKGMTFTSLGIAVAIGFLFYVANAVSIAFGKGGAIHPILAAWAAPILFAGISIVLIESDFSN